MTAREARGLVPWRDQEGREGRRSSDGGSCRRPGAGLGVESCGLAWDLYWEWHRKTPKLRLGSILARIDAPTGSGLPTLPEPRPSPKDSEE